MAIDSTTLIWPPRGSQNFKRRLNDWKPKIKEHLSVSFPQWRLLSSEAKKEKTSCNTKWWMPRRRSPAWNTNWRQQKKSWIPLNCPSGILRNRFLPWRRSSCCSRRKKQRWRETTSKVNSCKRKSEISRRVSAYIVKRFQRRMLISRDFRQPQQTSKPSWRGTLPRLPGWKMQQKLLPHQAESTSPLSLNLMTFAKKGIPCSVKLPGWLRKNRMKSPFSWKVRLWATASNSVTTN